MTVLYICVGVIFFGLLVTASSSPHEDAYGEREVPLKTQLLVAEFQARGERIREERERNS